MDGETIVSFARFQTSHQIKPYCSSVCGTIVRLWDHVEHMSIHCFRLLFLEKQRKLIVVTRCMYVISTASLQRKSKQTAHWINTPNGSKRWHVGGLTCSEWGLSPASTSFRGHSPRSLSPADHLQKHTHTYYHIKYGSVCWCLASQAGTDLLTPLSLLSVIGNLFYYYNKRLIVSNMSQRQCLSTIIKKIIKTLMKWKYLSSHK